MVFSLACTRQFNQSQYSMFVKMTTALCFDWLSYWSSSTTENNNRLRLSFSNSVQMMVKNWGPIHLLNIFQWLFWNLGACANSKNYNHAAQLIWLYCLWFPLSKSVGLQLCARSMGKNNWLDWPRIGTVYI